MKSTGLLSLAVAFFLFFSVHSYSQVQSPSYNSINANCGGYYEYLPQGYNTNSWQNFPLIVFVHGIGELGNGVSDLPNLLNAWTALPRLIANGGFPSSFNVGGQNFSFIVISPQFKGWPSAADVNAVVDYAVQNYRVDRSRIYVTGLSMGGGATWDFAGSYPTKVAAVVPVAGAAWPDPTKAQTMASAKLGVWATHNQNDPIVSVGNTTGWISLLQQYGADVQSTIFQVSGHDAWTKTYDPNFTQNGVNIYQWMLQHQRNLTNPTPPNQFPSASAGTNQSITLPANSVTLSGSGSDPDGSISSYEWTQSSGPSQAIIVSASGATTLVNALVQGSYVFNLKVTDDKGATANSNVTITVNAAPNQPPWANAGTDQTITLPVNAATLTGSGVDPDGNIVSYEWNQTSGPAQSKIVSVFSASTQVEDLVYGTYVFSLKVTDNNGATATDNLTITVNQAPSANQPPIANAGVSQSITLPQNSVTLSGAGSDPDGSIASYEWNQTSGPSQATIVSSTSAVTEAKNLLQGSYVFTLKVTDDKDASGISNLTITVNAAPLPNQAPIANAGSNQTITLPQNSITLSGSGTDNDGQISSYEWSQTSGPAQSSISSYLSANTVVNNLIKGSYVFMLKVTDDKGATGTNSITVTVNEAPNQPPTANAGTNQTITLPQNSVTLSGSGSDPDGSIASYNWTQNSGPSQATIVSASSASTLVNNLIQGIYVFSLKVTDNQGVFATDNITITVNPAPNQLPVANAGSNQTITLPANITVLKGTGSDPDGTISLYQWSQVSGPSQANIRSTTSVATIIDSLKQGVYIFRFTVTDNRGAAVWDDVTITVNRPPNQPPLANAGTDQTITLPDNSVDFSGSVFDTDGSITSFQWSQISGPTKSSISSASPLAITVRNLVEGVYIFRLTVTDNDGATAWDDIKVTVTSDPRREATASIYPNPATNKIFVKIDALTLQSSSVINITNSAGTLLYTENFVRTGFKFLKQIDVSKWPSGVYYLSITTDINTNKTVTFVKQ